MKVTLSLAVATVAFGLFTSAAIAAQSDAVRSPANGILCDEFLCADKSGISNGLTAQYLGKAAADKLISQGDFDRTSFTLSNGIHCDVEERKCYEDSYTDPKTGKRSAISEKYSRDLFGGSLLRFWRPHT